VQSSPNSSVTINGAVATVDSSGGFFLNNVGLQPGSNTLQIMVTTPDNQTASQNLVVNSSGQAQFRFDVGPAAGLGPPFTVNFYLRKV
jgi:hypothetical protein